jgi:hypothetical protein
MPGNNISTAKEKTSQQILTALGFITGGPGWMPFGPTTVQLTNAVSAGVTIYQPGGGIVVQADITPGTYTIDRIRGAVLTNIVAATPSSKTDGAVYTAHTFDAINWALGDLIVYTFTGIVVTIPGGGATSFPPIQFWARITIEPDIESIVTATEVEVIASNMVIGAGSNASNTRLGALVRWITDNAALQATALLVKAETDQIGTVVNTGGTATLAALLGDTANISFVTRLAAVLAEIQDTTVAAGGGSNATLTRAGLLLRWIADNGATAASIAALNNLSSAQAQTAAAAALAAAANKQQAGVNQVFQKHITSAANAGDVVVATITSQDCDILAINVRSNGVTTADLTSVAISGGAGKAITFIAASDGVKANIAAADQQVSWAPQGGMITLAATKTIVITLVGTGATAVDLTITIELVSDTDGGHLV